MITMPPPHSPSVHFRVVGSFPTRHGRAWSEIRWLGEVKEDLLLAAPRRMQLVSLSTGKRKKKIKKIDPILKNVILVGKSI